MAKGFRIRVIGERASDVHRTRNMAEELHVEFTRHGYGTTSDPDRMTTELELIVESKRNLSGAKKLMKSILKKHYMQDDVEIESV